MEEQTETKKEESQIYALRTTANREDQVIDFFTSKLQRHLDREGQHENHRH